MCRLRLLLAVLLLFGTACRDDHVRLLRGSLGPARYGVRLAVSGLPAIHSETLRATMRVEPSVDGASLRLAIGGDPPIVAGFRRQANGQLALDTVQGVPPRSAGEADLASIVAQLDPPLPSKPVRLRETWSSTRRIATDAITAELTSRLRIVRFHRVAGTDTADIEGTVSGTLRTTGASGTFDGTVSGVTSIFWGLQAGRAAQSETRLVWLIPGVGRLAISTAVRQEG